MHELENALEYAVAVCKGQTILPEDRPAELQPPTPTLVRPMRGCGLPGR
jgi:hypothetical protein